MKKHLPSRIIPWFLVTVFVLMVASILITGSLFYKTQQKRIKLQVQNNLAAIADLKVDQIAQWRRERIVDGELLCHNIPFLRTMEAFLKSSAKADRKQDILTVMESFQIKAGYESSVLFDTEGKVRLAVSSYGDSVSIQAQSLFQEALHQRKVLLSDLHKSGPFFMSHMDLIVPLFSPDRNDSVFIGAFMFRIDPQIFLFPLLQTWPTPSSTSETLLFEQDGDSIVYLNELRHQKNTALTLRLPISREQLPAAMAVRGIKGVVEGIDYRDIPVLASIRPIPDSPWYINAKVDQEEIYAPLRLQFWIAAVGLFLFLLSAGVIVVALWRHQRAIFYRDKYLAELERQALMKHFDYIVKYANDGILLVDMNGNIIEANDQACRMYEYTREELSHLYIHDLLSQQSRSQDENQMKQVEERSGLMFETEHKRKDGTVFPVEVSSRFIKIDEKRFYQCIIRDITKRKLILNSLQASESFLNNVVNQSPSPMWISNDKGTLIRINQACLDLLHISEDDVVGKYNIFKDNIVEEQGFMPLVRQVFEAGETKHFELKYDSSQLKHLQLERFSSVILDVTIFPIKDPNGKITNAVIQHIDITERKNAEAAMLRSEERYKNLADLLPQTVFETNEKGILTFVNRQGFETFGYTEDDLIQNISALQIIAPQDRDRASNNILRRMNGEEVGQLEYLALKKDGSTFPMILYANRIMKDNRQIGLRGIVVDISDRERVEEAIQRERNLLRTLIDNLPDGIYVKDSECRKTIANPADVRNTGHRSEAEILGKDDFDLFPKEMATGFFADDQRVLKTGEPVLNREEYVLGEEGKKRWLLTSKLPLRNEKGIIIGLIGIGRDITARKQTEEALRQSESLFKLLVESSPVAIAVFSGPSKKLEYVSDRFTELFGYDKEEIPSMNTWWQLAYPVENYRNQIETKWRENVVETQRKGSSIEPLESVVTCQDGSTRYIESTFTSIGEDILVFFTDLTQHRLAQEALRQTHAFNELLIQTMPFGMNIVDEEGNILFVSKAMKEMLTVDVVNMCCWSVYKDDNQQCINCPLRKGISFGKPDVLEVTGMLGGKIFQISHVGMMYEGKKAMLEVFQDITEQKKLQQELMQSQKLFSIGTMAGGIAHDFNNILGIILGYSSLLHSVKDNPEKFSNGVTAIRQAVDRGAGLVRQILTFARKTDILFEPLSVSEIVNELVSMLQQTFPKIITFNIRMETHLPYINADHTQIHQALLNLCVNARDAMPNGGEISIEIEKIVGKRLKEQFPTATDSWYICLKVSDTGIGMDEITRNQIFDPFFTTKEKGKGTGLGLSVVYGIIQAHQGFVKVESILNHGTTFLLYFPVPPESSEILESHEQEAEKISGGNETLLLVEDEILLLDMLQILLESNGYTVFTAKDGEEAVQVYREHAHEIALVISDMGLPKLTGVFEFEQMKEINPAIRIIFASGFFEPESKARLENAGVKGFLQKPYVIEEVLVKIRKALGIN
jgi:two-component system, cell cycle sensor histidine kinase and response regulator CckA